MAVELTLSQDMVVGEARGTKGKEYAYYKCTGLYARRPNIYKVNFIFRLGGP